MGINNPDAESSVNKSGEKKKRKKPELDWTIDRTGDASVVDKRKTTEDSETMSKSAPVMSNSTQESLIPAKKARKSKSTDNKIVEDESTSRVTDIVALPEAGAEDKTGQKIKKSK